MKELNHKIDECLKRLYQAKDNKLIAKSAYKTHVINNIDPVEGRVMVEKGLIEVIGDYRQLTSHGIAVSEMGGWLIYLRELNNEVEEQRELQSLTKEELEMSIKQMRMSFTQIKHWWLILLITTLASAILGAWFQNLFAKL